MLANFGSNAWCMSLRVEFRARRCTTVVLSLGMSRLAG